MYSILKIDIYAQMTEVLPVMFPIGADNFLR